MVGDFERLAQEFVNPQAPLRFRIRGGQDARGRPWLRCEVAATVEVECQRCLQPVAVTVDSDRLLYLAAGEADAERIEAVLADEHIEVIVAGQSLDLASVIEDEVLLSLPVVPMHADCSMDSAANLKRQGV